MQVLPPDLAGQVRTQAGIVTRRQLAAAGVPVGLARSAVRSQRWRRLHPGVYATFTGPPPPLSILWAGALSAGDDAVLSHASAAWLWGLRADVPRVVTVTVPHGRPHRRSDTGLVVVQSRRVADVRHPALLPARTTVEATVLDQIHDARSERAVIDLVLTGCHQRLTTPSRLRTAMASRPRLRWRALAAEVLTEATDGVASPLELRYLRDVERPHGLPAGERNRSDEISGRRRYRDVRYRRWRVVVELDGRAAHPGEERELDDVRDNDVMLRGERTLRYGWRSVTGSPCLVAVQVAALLAQGGWSRNPTACRGQCRVLTSSEAVRDVG